MAIKNFIPTVWSETLYNELEKDYVGVKLCNRDFEGEIRGEGDRVKICGVGDVSVFDYSSNHDMPMAEILSDVEKTLIIDQAKGFNFCIDSVDKAQAKNTLMQAAMTRASNALADEAERYVYSLNDQNSPSLFYDNVTSDQIISIFAKARRLLMENNVPGSAEISLEIPPVVEEKLLLSKIFNDTDNSKALGKGYLGHFMGFHVYVSNNLPFDLESGAYRCIARTKRAISFAEQLSEVKAYEPELRHGDAVKGLHLYGAKIVYPKEIVFLDLVCAENEAV